MVQRVRRGFSMAERTEMWDRWQRGESLKAIGRAFGKPSSSIYNQLAPRGGIRPAPRRRSRLALTLSEREEISRGIVAQRSVRSMALLLGRSPSTVSREVRRNGGYDRYRAATADARAWARAHRPKRCKLAIATHSPGRRRATSQVGISWQNIPPYGGAEAQIELVSRADRWLVEARASRRRILSGVSRDHLSQFIRSSPRCA